MNPQQAELLAAARAVLDAFQPYITAWEAHDPFSGPDGEALYERLRSAVVAASQEEDTQ